MKAKKIKNKAVVAEEDEVYQLCVDHPYMSVLYKRIRTHRKKLEKIKALEQAQANEGKVLNAQQIALMNNKIPLEKLVQELEMLREQFIGVYNQEMELKQQEQLQVVAVETVTAAAKGIEQVEEGNVREKVVKQEEQVQEVEKKEMHVVEKPIEPVVVDQEKVEDFHNVYELLKTLHVVNLHQSLGKEVPMVLDFFSKVLLGNTRPPAELSYEENLIESLEEAKKYLIKSDKVFACKTTYCGLRALVDELVDISSKKPIKEEVEETVAEFGLEAAVSAALVEDTLGIPAVPAEINMMPQISFFTESQLESKHGSETAVEVKVTKMQAEMPEVVASEAQHRLASTPAPPLSFAAVTTEVSNERTPSPSASSGSSGNDKKEHDSGGNSPQGKNSRRRGQWGRWREKGSNSGGNKSGNGSPTKSRYSRVRRVNDEKSDAQRCKRSGSKEGGRPRADRGLRKQDNSSQHHTTPMVAPHA
ncbi:unnamed protein product [Peronospora belbahrii]|uniref:Caprin-1 dimerization domain-containing protein n=1 Tax=Peronospora belbahrii TaxID=622444 RepID=A0AAU9L9G4_9STRA|nr:unnamed protein product [Peronospora belbahrii]CAH0515110.1 unnamed protein product [Peronospora belbahrii]